MIIGAVFAQVNTPVGTVATTGIVTGFEIIAGNSNNFFKISPTGKINYYHSK
jgi:hypothetical protein